MDHQHVEEAMTDVLCKLEAITAHLRKHDCIEASNNMSKSANEICATFASAVTQLGSPDDMFLDDGSARPSTATSAGHGNANGGGNSNINGSIDPQNVRKREFTLSPTPDHRDFWGRTPGEPSVCAPTGVGANYATVSVGAPSYGVSIGEPAGGSGTAANVFGGPHHMVGAFGPPNIGAFGPPSLPEPTNPTPFRAPTAAPTPSTGAHTAVAAPPLGAPSMGANGLGTSRFAGTNNAGPGNAFVGHQSMRTTFSEPNYQQASVTPPAVPTGTIQPVETDEEKAAIMVITGTFVPGSLNHLTAKIREGPLTGVEISYTDGFARIIFLRAQHGLSLVAHDAELVAKRGYGRFGPGYTIVRTDVVEWDASIRQMEASPKERRRLTFARGGLLGKHLPFAKFESDVKTVAGADAVDFIWAFNSGNVTAVFKSVDVARTVQRQFSQMALLQGHYKGVQVTFSTDPCEKLLVLTHQTGIPGGRSAPRPYSSGTSGRRPIHTTGTFRRR